MNRLLTSAALLAFLGATVSAQTVAVTNQTAYYKKFLGCVSANTAYWYCNDGTCYSTNGTNSNATLAARGLTCSNNFNQDYHNPIYPSTFSYNHDIDMLDIVTLPVGQSSSPYLSLLRGESLRLHVRSVTDKSAYVELLYNTVTATGKDNIVRENNTYVQFLVFNDRLKEIRKFDVSKVDKVLLPQSADNFTVYLVARGADFNVTVLASSSIIGRAFALVAAVFAVFALSF